MRIYTLNPFFLILKTNTYRDFQAHKKLILYSCNSLHEIKSNINIIVGIQLGLHFKFGQNYSIDY